MANGTTQRDILVGALDRLRERLRIAVIHNGDRTAEGAVIRATHNPRSDKSYKPVAEDIAQALTSLGFRHVTLLAEDMRLAERLREQQIALAWLNTAGVQGYDAVTHAPAILELCGVPYVGHRPLLAATLDNKHIFKRECAGLDLPTLPFMVWEGVSGPLQINGPSRFTATFADHPGPFVVKPVTGRASQNVHVVATRAELPEMAAAVYRRTLNLVQIEPFIDGPEYCVSVCGPLVVRGGVAERRREPFVFSMLERRLEPGEPIFTSMDARPITHDRIRLLGPEDAAVAAELARLAAAVYREFQLRSLVRLDVRADRTGRLFILEANPKPDLMRPRVQTVSLVCAGLAALGMSYEDLILSLLLDRLDHYLRHRPALVTHIAAWL